MIRTRGLYLASALLWRYLQPQWPKAALLGFLLIFRILLQLLAPQVVRSFLDAAQAGSAVNRLMPSALLYLATIAGQQLLGLIITYASENVGWEATNQLRIDLVGHCLGLDMGFHKTHTPGELIERIDGDVIMLGNYFSQLVIQVGSNGLLVLGIMILLFDTDWRVGMVGSGYAMLVLLFLRAMQNRMVHAWARVRRAYANLFGFLEERLAGMEDIRANGAGAYIMRRFFQLQRAVLHGEVQGGLLGGFTYSTSYFLYVASLMATLGLGATLYLHGEISIGTVYLLVAYIGLLEAPIAEIQRQVADLQRVIASMGRINHLFGLTAQVTERRTATLPDTPLAVTFENVTFTYRDNLLATGDQDLPSNGTTALQGISFQLAPGRILGLLGRTGSGKTTLARMLFRLYDVERGAIRLNHTDIRDVGLSDLRRSVGMVTQEVQLFAASVRDNLTFFNQRITDEQILAALEQSGLAIWAHSLPAGLDTMLEGGGKGLSAGEAQLLALTRVFLRDPGLVVLDEASSRLDPATEQRLEQTMERLLAERTGIIIAHRLKTVQRADDILILENGRIIEHGPRETLAKDSSTRFYHLLQTGLTEVLA